MITSSSFDPFGFLTPSRSKAFQAAIDSANAYHQSSIAGKAHVYEHIGKWEKAFTTRGWGLGHIMESFSNDDGAVGRRIFNISGIEFDKKYFVRLLKLENPDYPPPEPKTIARAREKANQLRMQFPGDAADDDERAEIPLHELYIIVAGYIVNKAGLITALYFLDQYGDTVRDYRLLDASSAIVHQVNNEKTQLPKTTFTLKQKLNKKDNAQ